MTSVARAARSGLCSVAIAHPHTVGVGVGVGVGSLQQPESSTVYSADMTGKRRGSPRRTRCVMSTNPVVPQPLTEPMQTLLLIFSPCASWSAPTSPVVGSLAIPSAVRRPAPTAAHARWSVRHCASLLRTLPTGPPPWLPVIRRHRQQCDAPETFSSADRAIAGSSGDHRRGPGLGMGVWGGVAGQLLQQRQSNAHRQGQRRLVVGRQPVE
jgi:hypothetical protein